MIKEVFAVYDKRSQLYGNLMTCRNKVEAMRNFEQACATSGTPLNSYPLDFDLVKVCDFNDETGHIGFPENGILELVCSASDYVGVADEQKAKQRSLFALSDSEPSEARS